MPKANSRLLHVSGHLTRPNGRRVSFPRATVLYCRHADQLITALFTQVTACAMPEDFDPRAWLTTQEAADLSHYNVRYLRQLVNEGQLVAVKRGGLFWFERTSLEAYVTEMQRLGPAKHDPWRTGARRRLGGAGLTPLGRLPPHWSCCGID